jgi:hypothetical protein
MLNEVVQSKRQEFSQLAEQYEKKWSPLLGESLEGYTRSVTSILLENQLEYIEKNRGMLTEATVTGDISGPERVLLPIVRRFYPALVANKLVGVQPMTTPSSLVFYLRYFYSNNKGKTDAGDEFIGIPGAPGPYADWAYDPYYSSTELELDVDITGYAGELTFASASIDTDEINKNLSWLNQLGDTNVVTSNGWASYFNKVSDAGSAASVGSVDKRAEVSSISINKTTGVTSVTFDKALDKDTDGVGAYPTSMTVWVYGDFEFREELPEVDLRILSESVLARTRKLKTKWSNEAEQDMKIIHNIDAEKELIALLSNEIALEIDREILRDLLMQSFHKEVYDFKSVSQQLDYLNPNKGLADRLVQLANKVYKFTKLGAANWMVTSPEIAAKLETVTGFDNAPAGTVDNTNQKFGISYAGRLNNKIDIYKDAIFPSNKVLMGYKGDNFMQSGYFYTPYVPVQMTPTIIDPEDFTPRKGLMTRYGKILVDGGQYSYAQMTVLNLVY